ncbi:hypothetical protein [Methylobacterium aerolatum]|uniref:Uncharacterized protein n=1 Tax=Methylobacterium aerolatum TaxID=418708 RepID=A0ABU0I0Q1_9HYPH|nr:hypothetical protein [Methylobacterium aerolatum]MDQ0447687.1 hypothetical protein [Methylobacterium aerolatum]GJD34787.1 hypothetical protein FMGBMHLM_1690 [Methylobacterium aerolatum]
MSYHDPIAEIRRLGAGPRIGAIVLAEQIVDSHIGGFGPPENRRLALDAMLRDLARLRRRDPALDGFVTQIETYIDGLHRELDRRAA